MRRIVMSAMALFVCLTISACGTEIEIQEKNRETPAARAASTGAVRADGAEESQLKTVGSETGSGSSGLVPSSDDGFLLMKKHTPEEESGDTFLAHMAVGEDSREAWEKVESSGVLERKQEIIEATNAYLQIPLGRMNREYLEWLKEADLEYYNTIKKAGYADASIRVVASDDFDRIQMIYETCSTSDRFAYQGKYSVYNYQEGEEVSVEKREIVLDNGKGDVIEGDRFSWKLGKVTYDCPWYLDKKNGTEGITVGMSTALYQKYFEGQTENTEDTVFRYYVVQAKEGKGEMLKECVSEHFPGVWITGGVFYR